LHAAVAARKAEVVHMVDGMVAEKKEKESSELKNFLGGMRQPNWR
jgi:hypothetical protein